LNCPEIVRAEKNAAARTVAQSYLPKFAGQRTPIAVCSQSLCRGRRNLRGEDWKWALQSFLTRLSSDNALDNLREYDKLIDYEQFCGIRGEEHRIDLLLPTREDLFPRPRFSGSERDGPSIPER
jgi:hypothetical protein